MYIFEHLYFLGVELVSWTGGLCMLSIYVIVNFEKFNFNQNLDHNCSETKRCLDHNGGKVDFRKAFVVFLARPGLMSCKRLAAVRTITALLEGNTVQVQKTVWMVRLELFRS